MGTWRSPRDGQQRCHWKSCGNAEVDGLEYCVFHVPDEYLEEAEEISGVRRCRHGYGTEDCCRRQAVQGCDSCTVHGANKGSLTRTIATQGVI
jgi:hypothetical protein